MIYFNPGSSNDRLLNYASAGAAQMDRASQGIMNELNKERPNMGRVMELQNEIQKGKRKLEFASNLLRTINNILQKVIDKLQVR